MHKHSHIFMRVVFGENEYFVTELRPFEVSYFEFQHFKEFV